MTRSSLAIAALLALAVPALPGAAVAARKTPPKPHKPKPKPPALDGLYLGPTSQTSPTPTYGPARPQPMAKVQVTGKKTAAVTFLSFDYVATCPDGKYYQTHVRYQGHVKIRRNRWSGTFRYSPFDINGAFVGDATYTVAGRFPTVKTGQGTFAATVVIRDAQTHEVVETCRTGPVAWAVKKHGA